MFGLSFGHLLILGIIILVFVGPEQLPEVARTIARVLNELRRATSEFQSHFTNSVDLQKWEQHLQQRGPPPGAAAQVQAPIEPAGEVAPPAAHGYPSAPAGENELPVGARPVSGEEKKS